MNKSGSCQASLRTTALYTLVIQRLVFLTKVFGLCECMHSNAASVFARHKPSVFGVRLPCPHPYNFVTSWQQVNNYGKLPSESRDGSNRKWTNIVMFSEHKFAWKKTPVACHFYYYYYYYYFGTAPELFILQQYFPPTRVVLGLFCQI